MVASPIRLINSHPDSVVTARRHASLMGLSQLSISRLPLIPSMTCHPENSIHSGTINKETHFQEVVKCITSVFRQDLTDFVHFKKLNIWRHVFMKRWEISVHRVLSEASGVAYISLRKFCKAVHLPKKAYVGVS